MKKVALFVVAICLHTTVLWAAPIENYPITLEQPDGTTVACFLSGDEYYNWVHDAQGYTLIRDAATGWIVYARLENDKLVSSGYVVGSIEPASLGLQPRTIVSAAKRTQLRQAFHANTTTSGERSSSRSPQAYTPRTGTLNNLVIYIRFADEQEFTRQKSTIEDLFNGTARGSSLYSYFRDISDNNFSITSSFYPNNSAATILSFQDTFPRAYYQPYNATTNPIGYDEDDGDESRIREHNLLRSALEALTPQIEADFTSSQLDYNNDGNIDNICFVIQGSPGAWSSLLWPHRWSLYSSPSVYISSRRAYDYNLILESHIFSASNGRQSVLVHETYHTLGAPDLYRYSQTFDPVGKWDVMCSNTVPPQSSSAHISNKYGKFIADPPTIVSSGTYTVYDIWDRTPGHNIAYKIASPNSATEY
ncbi:MAG: hypothetical protein LBV46_03650, partial [Bacteroidales bacterium]|nr:hypothetical protein [Bacteroidales bacterium]